MDREKLLKIFYNNNFPLSENSLNKLIVKLRKCEDNNKSIKNFKYGVKDDMVGSNYTDYDTKEISIGYVTNRLLNTKNSKNKEVLKAYKTQFLTSFKHEFCHEKQYDEYLYITKKGIDCDEYRTLLNTDFKYYSTDYNPFQSLIEIYARYNSVKEIVADIIAGRIEDDKNIYPFLLCEVFHMLRGINCYSEYASYQKNPFNAYRILKVYDQKYKYLAHYNAEQELSEKFKANFTTIFENKMHSFFENEYKFILNKVIENYKPSKFGFVYLTANWKNRVNELLKNPTYRDLWVVVTDSLKQIKEKALDFEYTEDDIAEFLLSKYNRADKIGYDTFIQDERSHKLFERFIMQKNINKRIEKEVE